MGSISRVIAKVPETTTTTQVTNGPGPAGGSIPGIADITLGDWELITELNVTIPKNQKVVVVWHAVVQTTTQVGSPNLRFLKDGVVEKTYSIPASTIDEKMFSKTYTKLPPGSMKFSIEEYGLGSSYPMYGRGCVSVIVIE